MFVPPELVKNISLNYLRANYWIPLRRSEDVVEVLIDDPYSFQKLQDVKRLFPVKEVKCFVGLREDILQFVSSVATDLDPNSPKQSIAAILDELTTEDQAKAEETTGRSSTRTIARLCVWPTRSLSTPIRPGPRTSTSSRILTRERR